MQTEPLFGGYLVWHVRGAVFRNFLISLCGSVVFAAGIAQAGPINFVVAESSGRVHHFDSYVLPLTEPADIAAARNILHGPTQIVFAAIAPGSDGTNRNDYNDQVWSWRVTRFL